MPSKYHVASFLELFTVTVANMAGLVHSVGSSNYTSPNKYIHFIMNA